MNQNQQRTSNRISKTKIPPFLRRLLFSIAALASLTASGQTGNGGQNLRGTIVDQALQRPVAGATVCLTTLNRCAVTDSLGAFRFKGLPLGKQKLRVTGIGYRETTLEQVALDAGKKTVLTIALENDYRANNEVVVRAQSRRNKPLNEMSAVSARAFTVEETQRYAAALNDPSRMATAFPGVFATDDGNNNIAIRGNSPTGLLWRMEGVDIPNPNHFASTGSSGGGVSILSAQLLANSDFVTGAFAPEYGNALSGVFDLRLRKGNNEKREYTLQAGLLGLNAAAEGPFRKGYRGSYLVNYRYSTLQLLRQLGVDLASGSINFQDLSYNLFFPTKKAGDFTVFGFHGRSDQQTDPDLDSSKWTARSDRMSGSFVSNTDATGITHTLPVGQKASLRTVAAFSASRIHDDWRYIQDDYSERTEYADDFRTQKATLSTSLRYKAGPRAVIRAGLIGNLLSFRFFELSRAHEQAPLQEVIRTNGNTATLQAFAQAQYQLAPGLSVQGGLHYLALAYNGSRSLEPRGSIKWQMNPGNTLAFGFGQHSQLQPLGVYFAQHTAADGTVSTPNKSLDLSKARHYVLSYQRSLARYLAFKAEVYYQQLFHVPVSKYDSSTLSLLNIQSEYVTDPLVNKGTGRNYGVELSLEKYLDKAFYYTLSTSVFESKYKALDGVERNTRFNGNYILSLVAGKEFGKMRTKRVFGVNVRTIYAGGLRQTPLDLARSQQEGHAVYREQEAFSRQNPAYFRTDLRLSMKWNRRRHTSTLSLDIQNLTNRENIAGQLYDSYKSKEVTAYQAGLIPVLNYKIEF